MGDIEKVSSGIQEPEPAYIPPPTPSSQYNGRDRDIEASIPPVPPSPSLLGQNYGMSHEDRPSHPPRQSKSFNSLRHPKSSISLRSSSYIYNGNGPLESRNGPTSGGGEEPASVAEELAWGPSHPCFPHMNPHVPLKSREYITTRIIRIRRDWMVRGDLAPTFSNLYPEILDPLVEEQEFRDIIHHINKTLVEAFDPFSSRNWLDAVLGLLTGWLWDDLGGAGVKKRLRGLEKWIEEWNQGVGAREGTKIIPLRRTGYMNLDIQIPDPQVRVVGEDGGTRPGSVAVRADETAA